VSCTHKGEQDPKAAAAKGSDNGTTSSSSYTPGEAGGSIDETIKASATVEGVDLASRKVTLRNEDGTDASFTAPAEMRNLDQLHVGDKVTATVLSRLTVLVTHGSTDLNASHAAAIARAPKGAKPGAIVAEQYELTASVKAIDAAQRLATLEFADGTRKVVKVRPDVNLDQYHVGDTVYVRVTQQLMVVAESP